MASASGCHASTSRGNGQAALAGLVEGSDQTGSTCAGPISAGAMKRWNARYAVPPLQAIARSAGNCAISVPSGLCSKSGMPIGLQIIGDYFAETTVFRAAAAYEAALGFDTTPPLVRGLAG